jgi:hypothetical protein
VTNEQRLIDKLQSIEWLHAGAAIPAEKGAPALPAADP